MAREAKIYHWFVSSCAHWRTGENLREVLNDIHKVDRSIPKTKEGRATWDTAVALWRVPGPSTSEYRIEYYNPQVEGALFVGYVDLSEGLIGTDEERTITPKEAA